MNVSPLEEYGLRCAVQLASLPEGESLSAPEIAEREGLSVEYVSKFMLLLKRGGLVKTIRGIKGGFLLAKHPAEIPLKEVFDALKQNRKTNRGFCDSFSGKSETCVRSKGCAIRPFWQILSRYIEEFTTRLTLQDLLQGEEVTSLKTRGIALENVARFKEEVTV
ncbi:MAG: Rrf2 family transcriptional regulator [Bdellovibrionales bacterium]|nr:Rrf2 family transcriptional regulator [Bdellovibrionales bacterium]